MSHCTKVWHKTHLWRSTFTEIGPLQPFLYVKKGTIRCDFLGKAIRRSVKTERSPRKLLGVARWSSWFCIHTVPAEVYCVYLSAQNLLDSFTPSHSTVICPSRFLSNLSRQAEWLMYGNLLCISLDGSFEEPVWAVVERHIVSERFVTKRLRMFFEISVFSNPWSNLRENWFYNKVRSWQIVTTITTHENKTIE